MAGFSQSNNSDMNKIDIFLVYLSNEGREVYMYEMLSGKDAMDAVHYEPSGYWNAYGGFEIVVNDYYTILHVTDFSYLVKVTDFLLHTLYWLSNKKVDWFDEEETDIVMLKTTSGNSVSLKKKDLNTICVSFLPPDNMYVRKRGDKFFECFLIDVMNWKESVNVALGEYFTILNEFILNNADDPMSNTMNKYLKLWEDIKIGQSDH
jgi:hypothetical protein